MYICSLRAWLLQWCSEKGQRSNYATKEARLPLCKQNRKRHYFNWSLSPGYSGTTGITVENLHCKRKEPVDGGGKKGWGGGQQHISYVHRCSALWWSPSFRCPTDVKAFNGTPPIHMNNNNWTLSVLRILLCLLQIETLEQQIFYQQQHGAPHLLLTPPPLLSWSASDYWCVFPSTLIEPPSWTLRARILRHQCLVTCWQQRSRSNEHCCWK